MNLSRRHEPFRYTFAPVLPCLIRLSEINRNQLESKEGEAGILDLSPNGCKLETKLNFHAEGNECKVALIFRLVQPLEIKGDILWQEQKAHGFQYGIRFVEQNPRTITDELKQYAKQLRRKEEAAASPE